MRIFLAPAATARLLAQSRVAAFEHTRAGDFGEPLRLFDTWFAPLDGIEAWVGRRFTETQIQHAVDGFPDRCVTRHHHEEEFA
jgi:hypothetical protein